ncbi:hypothetical protein TNCV_2964661 [Trichonephila clavipes]|nr:hypothetical protein TNCV_2964661 [Trichonephila clavipes]
MFTICALDDLGDFSPKPSKVIIRNINKAFVTNVEMAKFGDRGYEQEKNNNQFVLLIHDNMFKKINLESRNRYVTFNEMDELLESKMYTDELKTGNIKLSIAETYCRLHDAQSYSLPQT